MWRYICFGFLFKTPLCGICFGMVIAQAPSLLWCGGKHMKVAEEDFDSF